MAECEAGKADNKREHDDNGDRTHSKCKRSHSPKQDMKIIDLNNECLEKIFKRLDLQSLFSVAIANEWLRPTAAYVYSQNFGTRSVIVSANSTPTNCPNDCCMPQLVVGNDYISVNGMKTCLRYLRCFGASISKLDIRYDGHRMVNRIDEYIHQYVNTYCANSLERISFSAMPNALTERLFNPLVNVDEVNVHGSALANQFTHFPKWFPNVRRLKLSRTSIDHRFSGVAFQHLDRLEFDFKKFGKFSVLCKESATRLLQSNQQLKRLHVSAQPDRCEEMLTSTLNMVKNQQRIYKLVVWTSFDYPLVNAAQMQRIVNEHPRLIELDLVDIQFTTKNAVALVHQLKLLKKFRFKIKSLSDYEHLKEQTEKEWECVVKQNFNVVTMTRKN